MYIRRTEEEYAVKWVMKEDKYKDYVNISFNGIPAVKRNIMLIVKYIFGVSCILKISRYC